MNEEKAVVLTQVGSAFFYFSKGSLEQAETECDWLVMSSVFVASQSGCLSLCAREQTRLVELSVFSTTTNVVVKIE
jgi:hypothetical protein